MYLRQDDIRVSAPEARHGWSPRCDAGPDLELGRGPRYPRHQRRDHRRGGLRARPGPAGGDDAGLLR